MKGIIVSLAYLLSLSVIVHGFSVSEDGTRQYGLPPPKVHVPRHPRTIETTFTQIQDHFDATNTNTWEQRYMLNDMYFKQKDTNVVFLMVGGESAIMDMWMSYGTWMKPAYLNNALIVQLEHRYYGESMPTPDLKTESLRLLSSAQALEDIANFIVWINEQYNLTANGRKVKWVTFAGSYPANLAAWARQKYPHLVHGAISSSGPNLAKVNFEEYFDVVRQDLILYGGQECVDATQAAFQQLEDTLSNLNTQNPTELLNYCSDVAYSVNNEFDISLLFHGTAQVVFGNVAQYNKMSGNLTLADVCNIMKDKSVGSELQRLAKAKSSISTSCTNINFDALVNSMRRDDKYYGSGRSWQWQTCTEFGFKQTSTKAPHVFSNRFPLKGELQLCSDVFGAQYNEKYTNAAARASNARYGGLDINVTNVVYVHGTVDQWHALGVLEDRNDKSPAIVIPGTVHCQDMYEDVDTDPPELLAARDRIVDILNKWLAD